MNNERKLAQVSILSESQHSFGEENNQKDEEEMSDGSSSMGNSFWKNVMGKTSQTRRDGLYEGNTLKCESEKTF